MLISLHPDSPTPTLRVLISEDNDVNQQVASRLLSKLGHRADVANGCGEAVVMPERGNYDLILNVHELRGTAATVGATDVSKLAAQLEEIAAQYSPKIPHALLDRLATALITFTAGIREALSEALAQPLTPAVLSRGRTGITLADLLESLLALYRPDATAKGLRLSGHLLPTVHERAVADPDSLPRVLAALVKNAIASTETGFIAIRVPRTKVRGDDSVDLEFDVEDTGISLSPEKAAFLFTAPDGGGRSRLTLSQALCSELGGTIQAETGPNKGSLFRFSTTVGREPTGAAAGVFVLVLPLTELAVDDNDINRDVVKSSLEQAVYAVTLAAGGTEAADWAKMRRSGFGLMGLHMPDMDGLATTRRIRGLLPPYGLVPIIALTAVGSADAKWDYALARINGFVGKPLHPTMLFDKITKFSGSVTSGIAQSEADHKGTCGISL